MSTSIWATLDPTTKRLYVVDSVVMNPVLKRTHKTRLQLAYDNHNTLCATQVSSGHSIFGLNVLKTEQELEKKFSKHGQLNKIKIMLDGRSGCSMGFVLLYFK